MCFYRRDPSSTRLASDDITCILHLLLLKVIKEFCLRQFFHGAFVFYQISSHFPVVLYFPIIIIDRYFISFIQPLEQLLGPIFITVKQFDKDLDLLLLRKLFDFYRGLSITI